MNKAILILKKHLASLEHMASYSPSDAITQFSIDEYKVEAAKLRETIAQIECQKSEIATLRQELDAANAKLKELEWRPIESALKDGTEYLLSFGVEYIARVGRFSQDLQKWCVVYEDEEFDDPFIGEPIYFMLIPKLEVKG